MAGKVTKPSLLLLQPPSQSLQSVAPGIPKDCHGKIHLSFQQGMTRRPTRAYAHATELS